MPRKKAGELPSLRRHKPTKQGVVTLNGHDHYMGVWPDDQTQPPRSEGGIRPDHRRVACR